MTLQEIEIFDFKSIKHERLLLNSNQLCLVGTNESGKTSVLEAISFLNVLDTTMRKGLINKSSSRYPGGFPQISGVFSLTKKDREEIVKAALDHGDSSSLNSQSKQLIKGISDNQVSTIELKRWGNGFDNLSLRVKFSVEDFDLLEILERKAEFLDKFFDKIYPIIEYYEDEELLIEPATTDELFSTDKRFETFRRLLYIGGCTNIDDLDDEDEAARISFLHNISENVNQIFKKHYKQDASIEIIISPAFNNKIALSIKDSTKKIFSISERSPGFQYYFSFLVNKIYLNQIHKSKGIVYLLDEPGYNLHPKGAKDLIKTFSEVSEKNQIIYTTHNPFLTIRNNIDSLVFVQKDADKGSRLNRKPYLNKYQILRKELGILLNDSFILGDINLVVEGATEKLALHRLFTNEFEDLQWLNIYNSDGVNNVSQALNYLGQNNLNLAGLVLLDSDGAAQIEQNKRMFQQVMKQENWDFIEVNSVFPGDKNERTFEDLFPQDLYIGAFNRYCQSLAEFDVFSKPYTSFPSKSKINSPILNTLTSHYFSFIDEDKRKSNSISKQDVMRYLLDDIDKMSEIDQEKAFSSVYKLLKVIREKISKISRHVSH